MKTLAQRESTNVTPTAELEKAWMLPAVDIHETVDGYVLKADMPGVTKQGLEITLEDSELTLIGHRAPDAVKGDMIYRESKPADFRRTFQVDPSIDTGHISAQLEQGLLTLRLPKAERVKPRKITVS